MTLQREVKNKVCQRRDVKIQCRDLKKAWVFGFFQHRDVAERGKFKTFAKLSNSEKTL